MSLSFPGMKGFTCRWKITKGKQSLPRKTGEEGRKKRPGGGRQGGVGEGVGCCMDSAMRSQDPRQALMDTRGQETHKAGGQKNQEQSHSSLGTAKALPKSELE